MVTSKVLSGRWIGGYTVGVDQTFLELHFIKQENTLQGFASMIFNGNRNLEISDLEVNGYSLNFTVDVDQDRLAFNGEIADELIFGRVMQANRNGTFHLTKTAEIDQDVYDAYLGCYQVTPDRAISISNFQGELWCNYPVYLDHTTRQFRALFPTSETEYTSGPTFMTPYPAITKVTFVKDDDGAVTGLHWTENGTPSWAPKVPFRQEAVQFTSGDATLSGTLKLPLTEGPHPAVILLHGSGAQHRNYADLPLIADFFALNGIAVLAYDKRGVGASTSGSSEELLPDLAKDALAGLALLKTHDAIRANQIGLWGLSQGGWIAPTAAALSPDVAFVIIVSGPAVGVLQQDLDRVAYDMRTNNFGEAEVLEAVAHQRLFSEACTTGEWSTELSNSIQKVQQKKWAHVVTAISREKFDEVGLRWGRFRAYDPGPYLEVMTCPFLALFGEKDTVVPPEQNVELMEAALKKSGNPDYTIKVFPNGTHTQLSSKTGTLSEVPYQTEFATDYFKIMRDWILKRVDVADWLSDRTSFATLCAIFTD